MKRDDIRLPADSVAVIGMAGRFPQARTVAQFWENLEAGRDTIARCSPDDSPKVAPEMWNAPNFVRAWGALDDVELFDADFFGTTPAEAARTGPAHRLLLECAWEALEDAGYSLPTLRAGVFVGAGFSNYMARQLLPHRAAPRGAELAQILLANENDHLATRIGYKLDLRGPCVTVQTACSTSLVAVHMACQSLLSGECDLALAGGASVVLPQQGYLYEQDGILSPDGRCRAFDANAQGTVPGNGVGLVLLKRSREAWEDGDTLWALVLGSAINNDGARKVGYTAPSAAGQCDVVKEALAVAGVDARTIGYIETHGTGTALGDPIEIQALSDAYGQAVPRGSCPIGSVKGNIGHVDRAAGIVGFIKAVLALKHRTIPASLHFQRPNPEIDFDSTPFFVNATLRPWTAAEVPRRAAVSAFGMGGTNAHVVLEEPPVRRSDASHRPYQLLPLSARSPEALRHMSHNLARVIHDVESLADVAYTLQVGRRTFAHRCAAVAEDGTSAAAALTSVVDVGPVQTAPRLAFLFPGQGSQYSGMARELWRTEPSFRETVDQCLAFLDDPLRSDVRAILLADSTQVSDASKEPHQTSLAQPALFVVEYALAKLWMEWGVRPDAMLGHSIGEYVAACLSNVFSLEDALRLVAKRGELMQSLPRGAMLAVSLGAEQAMQLAGEGISLAADNSPTACVLSGPEAAIAAMEARLAKAGAQFLRRLNTSHAFHSHMVEPVLASFRAAVERLTRRAPSTPYISGLTGDWIRAEQAVSPSYWVKQLRHTVKFREGFQRLLDRGCAFVEVGPGRTLRALAAHFDRSDAPTDVISSMGSRREHLSDSQSLTRALGSVWSLGAEIHWGSYWRHELRQRVPLPLYPFQRARHWIAGPPAKAGASPANGDADEGNIRPLVQMQLDSMVQQLEALGAHLPEVAHDDPIPVLPAQGWFLEQALEYPHHYNHVRLLEVRAALTLDMLDAATLAVIEAHEALRTKYSGSIPKWHAVIGDARDAVSVTMSVIPAEKDPDLFIQGAVADANAMLSLTEGRLMRLILFTGERLKPQRLAIVCHHVAIDVVSWSIVLGDLERACRQFLSGGSARLPAVPCTYSQWARELQRIADTESVRREVACWTAEQRRTVSPIPVDHRDGANLEDSASALDFQLDIPETASLLRLAPLAYRVPVGDLLLTALSCALVGWIGGPVLVDIESHGREDLVDGLDLSRTVGWLTAIFPLVLDVTAGDQLRAAVSRVRDQRQRIVHGGIGYGLLRYCSNDARVRQSLVAMPQAQVSFNHAQPYRAADGNLFAPLTIAGRGSWTAPSNKRRYVLDVECGVYDSALRIRLRYGSTCHRRETIERLGASIRNTLLQLIRDASTFEHGRQPTEHATTQMESLGVSGIT